MSEVSRQREWQKRKRAEGNCIVCGRPVWGGSVQHCEKHLKQWRENQRKVLGLKPWFPGARGQPPLERREEYRQFFTDRMEKVLKHLNEGYSVVETASALGIPAAWIRTYVKPIKTWVPKERARELLL